MGAVPSKNIPKVVIKLTEYYVDNRKKTNESFQEFYSKMKKIEIKSLINEFTDIPPYLENPDFSLP